MAGGSAAPKRLPKRDKHVTTWVTAEEDEEAEEQWSSAGSQRMHIGPAQAETQPSVTQAPPQIQPLPPDPAVGGHSIHTDPAGATFTDPAVSGHSIPTYPAGATFTDPAVGGHSIPTDPAATDPAVATPGTSPDPAVGGR